MNKILIISICIVLLGLAVALITPDEEVDLQFLNESVLYKDLPSVHNDFVYPSGGYVNQMGGGAR